MKRTLAGLLFFLSLPTWAGPEGIPMPKVRVEPSAKRAELFRGLTSQQKKLVCELAMAAEAGQQLLFMETHRHGAELRRILEWTLNKDNFSKTRMWLGAGFDQFLSYALYVQEFGGPYTHGNLKYYLDSVDPTRLRKAIHGVPDVDEGVKQTLVALMTDAEYEVHQKLGSNDDSTYSVGGNHYENGLTLAQVRAAQKGWRFIDDKGGTDRTARGGNLEVDFNSQVTVVDDGYIEVQPKTTKTPGPVGETLRRVVFYLGRAKRYAENAGQKRQLAALIRYFRTGEMEHFNRYSVEWVKTGANTAVNLIMGWVEVYRDPLARIGDWQATLSLQNRKESEIALKIAREAQYFEDRMPYGPWKKTFPPGYAPPAMLAYMLSQRGNLAFAGVNLPNDDAIRNEHGFVNIVVLPMTPGELKGERRARSLRIHHEFYRPETAERMMDLAPRMFRVKVLLHEIIGHGSGTFDVKAYGGASDPVAALGGAASALEEERADLTAIVFFDDPKLVELGLFKDAAEARELRNLMLDWYVGNHLMRAAKARSIQGAHDRGHHLYVNFLLEKELIRWVPKRGQDEVTDETRVLEVVDHDAVHAASVELLGILQTMKATNDKKGMEALFDRLADPNEINEPWMKALIARGEAVGLGDLSVPQPWRIVPRANGTPELQVLGGSNPSPDSVAPYLGARGDLGDLRQIRPHVSRETRDRWNGN